MVFKGYMLGKQCINPLRNHGPMESVKKQLAKNESLQVILAGYLIAKRWLGTFPTIYDDLCAFRR